MMKPVDLINRTSKSIAYKIKEINYDINAMSEAEEQHYFVALLICASWYCAIYK